MHQHSPLLLNIIHLQIKPHSHSTLRGHNIVEY
nr:MAG TPA: hypothetical protein [Caudoviricetes sp.]